MEEPVAVRRRSDAGGTASRAALVPDNLMAFALRAEAARTLDLQYYIWEEDLTGRLLAREVLQAADRGVKVRLLLDDLYMRGAERKLAALACHTCIDVRLYNPFQLRAFGLLGDAIEFLFASYRLNHRMHNKAWIADGGVAIAGGRNIGDEYFGAASQFNFRDLDLLIAGGAAEQAGAIFNLYWQHRRARPIGEVATSRPRASDLEALRRHLEATASGEAAPAYLDRLRAMPDLARLAADGGVSLPEEAVRVIADPPGKGRGRRRDKRMYDMILKALGSAQREVFVISPYFVPGRRGTRLLAALARRGIGVSILTNSLAATDVLAVHGRYARYRRRLLRAGVAVHELKRGGQEGQRLFGSGRASLHTKAFGVDGGLIFVGSFNFDPRSQNLNTEMGTFIHNASLAAALGAEFARLTDAARSWAVTLAGGRLAWTDRSGGREHVVHDEPDTTLGRRLLARLLGWLPIEPQL